MIIQLSKSQIPEENRITEEDINDTDFIGKKADYVYDISKAEREREIGYLSKLPGIEIKDQEILVFHRIEYFKERYQLFQKRAADLANVSLEEFATSYCGPIRMLNKAYEDPFGEYVYTATGDIVTLDSFIRTFKDNTPYYIGGIVECHF